MGITEPGPAGERKRHWGQFSLRVVLTVPVVLAILLYAISSIPASRGYSMKAEYSRLPADDQRLEAWLKVQQGVVARTVHVSRVGSIVRVHFIMVRNGRGRPSFPDLRGECESLEYGGLVSAWTDDWPEGGESWPASPDARAETRTGVVPRAEEQ